MSRSNPSETSFLEDPTRYANYPPRWETFNREIKSHCPADFDFAGAVADINRFSARYRAGRCFRKIEFQGLSATTADGYSALCRLLFAYSAFEYLLRALGCKQQQTRGFLTAREAVRVAKGVHARDPGDALFAFMRDHLDKRHKKELGRHLSGRGCNPFYLASGVRHLFAHGVLTPNPKGVPSETVRSVSRYLWRVLYAVMDREFKRRVDAFETKRRRRASAN